MRVSLKPGCSWAYSSAIACMVVMTAPPAARDSSHEISRGLISPGGSMDTGDEGAPPLAPQEATRGVMRAPAARARNWERLSCMVCSLG